MDDPDPDTWMESGRPLPIGNRFKGLGEFVRRETSESGRERDPKTRGETELREAPDDEPDFPEDDAEYAEAEVVGV